MESGFDCKIFFMGLCFLQEMMLLIYFQKFWDFYYFMNE